MRLPEHLRDKTCFVLLREAANGVRGYYGVPVYLCGSALTQENPRDWDVRLRMPNKYFEVKFGQVDVWIEEGATGRWTAVRWNWSADCVKQARWMSLRSHLNVDFQIYPARYWDSVYRNRPRLRLDTKGAPE